MTPGSSDKQSLSLRRGLLAAPLFGIAVVTGFAGLLVLMLAGEGMTNSIAAAATILIRFATLWFAVILGALAMIKNSNARKNPSNLPANHYNRHRHQRPEHAADTTRHGIAD